MRPQAWQGLNRFSLDAAGKLNATGKIVLLGVGFSNTVQGFNGFLQVAREDKDINPRVVLVNGAVGGMSAAKIQNPNDNGPGAKYWATVDERLKAAGVTRQQVQVIWLKETNPQPHEGSFPKYVQLLQSQLGHIVRILSQRFPNAKLVYLSSRTYGGWAKPRPNGTPPGNSEPFSYESGFAYKWLVEQQLKGDPELNYDETGLSQSPLVELGTIPMGQWFDQGADGFRFQLEDYREDDRMHHSAAGQIKIGQQLLQFFKTDSTTRTWFLAKQSSPRQPSSALLARLPLARGETATMGVHDQSETLRPPAPGTTEPAPFACSTGGGEIRALRDLATAITHLGNVQEVCAATASVLGKHRHLVSFALIYLLEKDSTARLAAAMGLQPEEVGSLPVISLTGVNPNPWWDCLGTPCQPQLVTDLAERLGNLSGSPKPDCPTAALTWPIPQQGDAGLLGCLVLGINPRRVLDDDYRGFLDLVGLQVESAIAGLCAGESPQRKQAEEAPARK